MNRIATILIVIVIVISVSANQASKGIEPPSGAVVDKQDNNRFGLPSGAVIIEEQSLESDSHPDRALIIWMVNPTKNPSGADPEEFYSCRTETRGSCYSGPTRVSLLNTESRTIINTIEIKQEHKDGADGEGEVDSFDIPYAIRKGYYYKVDSSAPDSEEVKPQIIWLRDYNWDGKPLEFALFNALACMGLPTTLIGYSEWQDKVIQYQIYLEIEGDDGHLTDLSP